MTGGVRYSYCTVGGNQTRLDARSEFESLVVLAQGGVEAGRKQSCMTNDVHDQLRLPFSESYEILYPILLDCHQPYIVIVAKPYTWPQETSRSVFRSAVRFPPV